MLSPLPRILALINGTVHVTTLIDEGCNTYAVVSHSFVVRNKLKTFPASRPLKLTVAYETVDTASMSEVATFELDIDGYCKRIFAYVVKDLHHEMILGTPWKEQESVITDPVERTLHLRFTDLRVPMIDEQREAECQNVQFSEENEKLSEISATGFMAWTDRIRKKEGKSGLTARICAVSLADINKTLKPKVKGDPRELLPKHYHQYLDVFNEERGKAVPPHREEIDHKISLQKDDNGKESTPPWGPLYAMSRDELLVLRKTLIDLMDQGFIRASSSPAGAPVLFVKKPGGGLRFCVDYRGLNKITRKDRYPLPLIKETLSSLSKAKWFTKMDVVAAFHKIRITRGQEWMTAFRTRYGLYEWNVTPFGLTGAPATFQRYINWVLREYLDEFCSAYVDDILVYTDGTLSEHREHVSKVLARLDEAGLALDIDKCEFEAKSVKYLGFIVTAGEGVSMDRAKVKAIRDWQSPTNKRGVRAFIGFANFYRGFIKDFSTIAAPITQLTGKNTEFQWSAPQEEAFQTLKSRFIEYPVLRQFDPESPTRLEADASGYAVGGALLQADDQGIFYPVAYHSQKMCPAQANYEIHDKELLAIIICLRVWRAELRSVGKFTIVTDHKNLNYFMSKKKLNERQARWSEELSHYDYDLVYRSGKMAPLPDGLSRRPQDMPKDDNDERLSARVIQVLKPRSVKVMSAVAAPANAYPDEFAGGAPPFDDEEMKVHWRRALEIDDGYQLLKEAVLRGDRFPPKDCKSVSIADCQVREGNVHYRGQLWVPEHEPLRTGVIQRVHDSPIGGHPGREATFKLVKRDFFWPGYTRDVARFVKNCDVCARSKAWKDKKQGLLQPLPVPTRVWDELSLDFITGLPPTKDGHVNLLVVTDRLSKGIVAIPMQGITTDDVARALWTRVFSEHGLPRALVSDRGTQFDSQLWKKACEKWGIRRAMSTAFHPETDGATERMNQVIEHYFRTFCTFWQNDWDSLCGIAQLAINNRPATSTGFSPFFLLHGYHQGTIVHERQDKTSDDAALQTPADHAQALINKTREAWQLAQATMAYSQSLQELQANRKRAPAPLFKVGDKVWLSLKNIDTVRPSKKLDWKNAKYTVTKVISPLVYELDTPGRLFNRFHVSLLHPASTDPFPCQVQDDIETPPIINEKGEQEWEVESIIKRRKNGDLMTRWRGYQETTWEPLENVEDTEAYEEFLRQEGSGRRRRRKRGGG